MEHRHINLKPGQWGVAAVHSIWERGSDHDIKELIHLVRVNPAVADAVRRAIPHSKVYGFPRFFELYLDKLYGKI
jgi:hypothetical protein